MEKNYPKISVCILTHNSQETIVECLESVSKTDYPNFEIIVVDDNSKDKTIKIIKNFEKKISIELIQINEKNTIGKLRNTAIKNSSGEFIAFTDSDCFVQKNWLKELIEGFKSGQTAGVGGKNLTPENDSVFQKSVGEFYSFFSFLGSNYVAKNSQMSETSHNPSCNVLYKKKALLAVNGFNESLASNEDPELDARLRKNGYKLVFSPKAIVFHHRKKKLNEFFNQAIWYGMGRMQAMKKNIELTEWFRMLPLVLNLILLALLFFFFFWGILMALLLLLGGMAFGLIVSAQSSLKKPLTYFLLFIAWWMGYSIGMLKGIW